MINNITDTTKNKFWNKISNKIDCIIFGHNWKNNGQCFYCVENYPKFTKLWQNYYHCTNCKATKPPKWFKKKWRIKNQFAIFSDTDLPFNLKPYEIEAYRKTKILIKILDNKNI